MKPDRSSVYGHIKQPEIVPALSVEEEEELERLERRQKLSPVSEARLDELWDEAFDAHVPPEMDPLWAYAEEVGARMRARLRADTAEDAIEDEGRDDR